MPPRPKSSRVIEVKCRGNVSQADMKEWKYGCMKAK